MACFLVTGGAGFLGINLVRFLLERGHGVVTLDIAPFDYPDVRGRVTEVQGDIRDGATVDRAMAGMLVLCIAVLLLTRRDRHVVVALTASVIGFAATLVRADTLPAAPYVDQILYSSFTIHAGAGLAVSGGLALLLVPAIVGLCRDSENRCPHTVKVL